jgi:hypothetical protein
MTYYEVTTTSKRSLISENVTVIRIDIHPAGEKPDQHVVRMTPQVSCMIIIHEVPTRLKYSSGLEF